MNSFRTARLIPEKADSPPALPLRPMGSATEKQMKINSDMARHIDRLREAAREHGAVADLLGTLTDCLHIEEQLDGTGRLVLADSVDQADLLLICAAIQAAAFVELDRAAQE